jgi:hypothetical protein
MVILFIYLRNNHGFVFNEVPFQFCVIYQNACVSFTARAGLSGEASTAALAEALCSLALTFTLHVYLSIVLIM